MNALKKISPNGGYLSPNPCSGLFMQPHRCFVLPRHRHQQPSKAWSGMRALYTPKPTWLGWRRCRGYHFAPGLGGMNILSMFCCKKCYRFSFNCGNCMLPFKYFLRKGS
jgi:hypothetical protein